MAWYKFEKIEIGFNLSYLLTQILDSTAPPRQGYVLIKKTQLLVQTVFLLKDFFSEKTLRICRGRCCLLYLTTLQMVRFQKI